MPPAAPMPMCSPARSPPMRNRIIDLVLAEARDDPRVVFMTGDLGFSVVEPLREQLGARFINAGVAEANMATMAGAMALSGLRVYLYSIAPFVTLRCLEQIRNDICYQGGDVRILGIGAGLSYGTLGPSHHALEDATVMAALPGMMVLAPAGPAELDGIFAAVADRHEPVYLRIGRETGPALAPPSLTPAAGAWTVRDGSAATVLASGAVLQLALDAAAVLAAEGHAVRVISVPVLHPYPAAAIAPLLVGRAVLTVIEAYPGNPLELGTLRLLMGRGDVQYHSVAVAHRFAGAVNSHQTLRAELGLSAALIADALRRLLAA